MEEWAELQFRESFQRFPFPLFHQQTVDIDGETHGVAPDGFPAASPTFPSSNHPIFRSFSTRFTAGYWPTL
jgi:hypothetical protein